MAKTFLFIKQGDYPSLGSLPGKGSFGHLVNPPRFFFPTPRNPAMNTPAKYKNVPFLQEKLKSIKQLIKIDQGTVLTWQAAEPDYPLLPKVKDQLLRNEKLLAEIMGGQPCQ